MRVTKDGKLKLSKDERQIGSFIYKNEPEYIKIMDINKVVRQCFLQYGYHEGVYPLTKLEYYMLSEQARKEYEMSLEDYVTGKGLNITFEVL